MTCRWIEVDGEMVRVQSDSATEWTQEDQEAFAVVMRAVRRRFAHQQRDNA